MAQVVGNVYADRLDVLVPVENLHDLVRSMDQLDTPPQLNECVGNGPWDRPGPLLLQHPQDIASVYIEAADSSEVRQDKCSRCRNTNVQARRYFDSCTTNKDIQNGACSNCVMKHTAAYCDYCKLKPPFLYSLLTYVTATRRSMSPPNNPPPPPRPGRDPRTRSSARAAAASSSSRNNPVLVRDDNDDNESFHTAEGSNNNNRGNGNSGNGGDRDDDNDQPLPRPRRHRTRPSVISSSGSEFQG